MRGAEKALLVVMGLLIVGLAGALLRRGGGHAADDGRRCLEQGASCSEHSAGLGQVVHAEAPHAGQIQQPGEIQQPGGLQQPGEIQQPVQIEPAQPVSEPAPPAEPPPFVPAGDFSDVNFACRARYFRALISNNGYSPTTLADYGNYCGKGGSGEPIDAIDACCQAHDNCYGDQSCSIFNNACTAPCNTCDDSAMRCWIAARHADPGRFGQGNDFRYPCYDCSTNDRNPSAAKRQRCNSECRSGMFP